MGLFGNFEVRSSNMFPLIADTFEEALDLAIESGVTTQIYIRGKLLCEWTPDDDVKQFLSE